MVHMPRHPQSQGSVEHANGNMLVAWMSENKTQDWSDGLCFVQNKKMSTHHSGVMHTPYKAMFGSDPKVGLTSSIPSEVLERLQTYDLLSLNPAHTPQPKPTTSPKGYEQVLRNQQIYFLFNAINTVFTHLK